MKTLFVCTIALSLAALGTTQAGSPKEVTTTKVKSAKSNAKSNSRKPAPAQPAVAQSQGWQPPKEHWNWRRTAMQPFRFIVMVAKVPCIIAGYPAFVAGCVVTQQQIPDPGPMFANFDPGPAIDADLEGYGPVSIPTQQYAPTPVRSIVRPLNSSSASTRPGVMQHLSINRYWKPPVALTGKGTDLGPNLDNLGLDSHSKIASDFRVSGPLLDTSQERSGVAGKANSSIADSASLDTPAGAKNVVVSQR